MSKSFKRLTRVLKLEKQQGYQNKSVVGGIRQLATFWVSQAREEVTEEGDKIFVEQIAETLVEYDRLPSTEKRADMVDNMLEKLEERLARMPATKKRPSSRPPQQHTPPPPPSNPPPAVEKQPSPPKPERKQPPKQNKQRNRPTPQKSRKQAGGKNAPFLKIVPSSPDADALEQPVTILKGVGPSMAGKLAKLNIHTVGDILHTRPRRYDDYSLMKPINKLEYGEVLTVIGTVWEVRSRRTRTGELTHATVSDGTGRVQINWFNQPWLAKQLNAGMQIVISGKVEQYLGRPVFNSPQWETLEMEPLKTRRIQPVYPLTEGLKSYKMRDIAKQTVEQFSAKVPDPLPKEIGKRNDFLTLPETIQNAHFPEDQEALFQANRRLVFDELFLLQLGMLGQRRDWQENAGIAIQIPPTVVDRFIYSLPFHLTKAQRRVITEIMDDMANPVPMNRLIQGDVGAGKTVVAAAAMVNAVKGGGQAALMAPTEILAEQHYQGLTKLMADQEMRLGLLTGSTKTADREQLLADLIEGNIDILIGTHSLIQETVIFNRLALAVIDEQHRFGVDQRQALRLKGPYEDGQILSPHLLVMSATPIPRTLALSFYGDLDLSVIDELPPGRQEIKTRWLRPSERERAYSFVRGQIEKGRQVFVICPLVEESDKIEAVSAVEEHTRLQKEIFPDYNLGLLHGRMSSADKEAVMRDFYDNKLHMLVSTSVIEVGIDVPNSTVMMIEGANRFGLAQLHQFRGRVGRGEHQSYCLLISDSVTQVAEQRLTAMEQTNDGFILAEKDLQLRGPGQFFGRTQSGLPEVQMAALLDVEALELARGEAQKLFEIDPMLTQPQHQALQARVAQFWDDAGDVS